MSNNAPSDAIAAENAILRRRLAALEDENENLRVSNEDLAEKLDLYTESDEKTTALAADFADRDHLLSDLISQVRGLEREFHGDRTDHVGTVQNFRVTNEELQAAIEKLRTANEGNQSSNEELRAVNEELDVTNEELLEREEKLRLVLGSTGEGIYGVDLNGNCLLCNPAAAHLLGYDDVDQLLGKHMHTLMHYTRADGSAYPAEECRLCEPMRTGRAVHVDDDIFWREDGTSFPVEYRSLPMRRSGNLIGAVVSFADITERMRSEGRYRSVAETARDAIVVIDRSGKVLSWNPGAERLFGFTATEMINTPLTMIMPERYRKRHENALNGYGRNEKDSLIGTTVEFHGRHKDGKEFPVELSLGTWEISGETFFSGIIRDITERKKMDATIRQSEKMLQEIIENSPMACTISGKSDGTVLVGNSRFAEIWGLADDEIVGCDTRSFQPDDKQRDRNIAHVEKNGILRDYEARRVRRDGTEFWILCSLHPFVYEGKEALLGWAYDITDRKRMEEALLESEERFRLLFDNAPLAYQSLDELGCFLDINQAWADLLGYPREEVVDRSFGEFIAPEFQDVFRDNFPRFKKAGKTAVEFDMIRKDGGRITTSFAGRTSHDKRGRFLRTHCILTDITERRRFEKDLFEAKEQAEFANRSKTEFLANMSHELRTPLTIINGASEILSTEMFGPIDNPSYLDYAKNIRDAGEHLLRLINDILNISQIEMGRFELDEDHMELNAIIASCHNLFESRAQEAGLSLTKEVKEKLPALRGDELRIKQVVLNLLSNAVKFTPDGGTVTLRTETGDDGRVMFSVSDTGIGIAAKDISSALDTFGQVEQGYSRNYQGAGIGLPLSKKLIELHGGTLMLESELGIGTTVTVRFPPERSAD